MTALETLLKAASKWTAQPRRLHQLDLKIVESLQQKYGPSSSSSSSQASKSQDAEKDLASLERLTSNFYKNKVI
jgi:hypothetical protein